MPPITQVSAPYSGRDIGPSPATVDYGTTGNIFIAGLPTDMTSRRRSEYTRSDNTYSGGGGLAHATPPFMGPSAAYPAPGTGGGSAVPPRFPSATMASNYDPQWQGGAWQSPHGQPGAFSAGGGNPSPDIQHAFVSNYDPAWQSGAWQSPHGTPGAFQSGGGLPQPNIQHVFVSGAGTATPPAHGGPPFVEVSKPKSPGMREIAAPMHRGNINLKNTGAVFVSGKGHPVHYGNAAGRAFVSGQQQYPGGCPAPGGCGDSVHYGTQDGTVFVSKYPNDNIGYRHNAPVFSPTGPNKGGPIYSLGGYDTSIAHGDKPWHVGTGNAYGVSGVRPASLCGGDLGDIALIATLAAVAGYFAGQVTSSKGLTRAANAAAAARFAGKRSGELKETFGIES